MNIVIWTFEEIRVVMVETDQGELYTTSPVLARALDVTPHSLSKTYNMKKEEFDGLRGTTFPSKSFLHNNRKQLGLSRVRSDVHLWSEGVEAMRTELNELRELLGSH